MPQYHGNNGRDVSIIMIAKLIESKVQGIISQAR
jgi:hypothetical protein